MAEMAGLFLALQLCDSLIQASPSRTHHFQLKCDNGPLVEQINSGVYAHCHHLVGLVDEYHTYTSEMASRKVEMVGKNIMVRVDGCEERVNSLRHSFSLVRPPSGRDDWHIARAHKEAHKANYHSGGARVGSWTRAHWQRIKTASRIIHAALDNERDLYEDH
jgi:hypothetical protein